MARNTDRVNILLTEYTQLNEQYRQRDTTTWVTGTIFIPIAVGILSYAAAGKRTSSIDGVALTSLAIASLAIFAVFRLLLERMRYFSTMNEERMKKIEKILRMDAHSCFDRFEARLREEARKMNLYKKLCRVVIDRGYRGYTLRVRGVLDVFMVVLTVAWGFVWHPFVVLFGVVWLIFFSTSWLALKKRKWVR